MVEEIFTKKQQKFAGILFFILVILMLIAMIIQPFVNPTNDGITFIINGTTYNESNFKIDNQTLPYLQFECIKYCVDNVHYDREYNCMKYICLELGK